MAATDALSDKQFPQQREKAVTADTTADQILAKWNAHPETDPLAGRTKGWNLGGR